MNTILRPVLHFIFKDFYSLKDLENPEFSEKLIKLRNQAKKFSNIPGKINKEMDMEECKVDGGIYYRFQYKNNKTNKKVFYIHGGGFFLEALKLHWELCYKLSKETGCEIIFPIYPLIPESNAEQTHNMLLSVYKEIINNCNTEDLTIIGDSAGGALALTVPMYIRDNGLPVPNEIVLISPGFNIGETNEEETERLKEIVKYDLILGELPVSKIKKLWRGNLDEKDYRNNALEGSLQGLPRITMFSGTHDILNIPARRLVNRMKKEGHPYCYEELENGKHCYIVFKPAGKDFELIKTRVLGN
ncbi:alpha/beta-hydrolase [Anaeromyces robustus]|uniref:Alpha/beta-hydrolase n=1 Tax=Anaeromyces robustus TaxID=1754192 RepID=A0A1Y1X2S3_9FUNG|nr:alpha/beta-hydrolase [Anaeromyces robustus]|eukprot:ORX79955.1 alpha/beta-hydrolase [Anaeromyces robustus]